MIKIEYETADYLPYIKTVSEAEAIDTMIKITAEGGHINWVERV